MKRKISFNAFAPLAMQMGALLLSLLFEVTAQGVQTLRATTENGRQVVLRADGTWEFIATPGEGSASAGRFVKSPSATKKINASHGQFALWIDPNRWTETTSEPGKIMLQHMNGEGYAMIISEAAGVPAHLLREAALESARQADPNVRLTSAEKRIVNNREILCLQIEGKIKEIPFIYYGYYYSGTSGHVQVITYTVQSAFATNKQEFTNLLNGLEIKDEPLSGGAEPPAKDAPGLKEITLNAGKISLSYDTRKWNEPKTDKGDKIMLGHVKGAGYALIIAEGLGIPIDSLPEIALENAKEADSQAKITFREKRKINGQAVWCLKISAVVSKLPIIYYGYYYGGDAGTVQVLTYTTPANFREYEADFTELLNSLTVKARKF